MAVGFVGGLLVPSTRVEDEKLGPMADQFKEKAKETGQEAIERGKEVAQQAAQSAKEAGSEHAQGLRETAQPAGSERHRRAHRLLANACLPAAAPRAQPSRARRRSGIDRRTVGGARLTG